MAVEHLVLIALSVAAGSFVKGVTGVGGPMLAIPVIAASLGVEHAVVVMAFPGVLMNAVLWWRYRHVAGETRDLGVLVAGGIVGVGLGTWALASLDDRWLSLGLAAAIAAYLVTRVAHPGFEVTPRAGRILSPGVGVLSGIMQGSTGISAPAVATYVHGFRLPRASYILSVSVLFQVFALAQVLVIASVGLYTWERLGQSALAAVPAVALLPVGDRVGRRLSHRTFDTAVLLLLAVLAGKLVYDVVTAG